jgi:hypothetical protein
MELSELTSLLEDPTKLVNKIKAIAPLLPDYIFDLEPELHRVVKDKTYRPYRDVEVPTGLVDAQNNPTYRTEQRDVHRIPSSTQKIIINWSVRMALSGGIEREYSFRDNVASDQVMAAMLDKTWEDNKLDYLCQKIDRLKKTYTQCLVVWYSVPAEPGFWEGIAPLSTFKMRCVVLSPEDGDVIIPIVDQYKDFIGAGREYVVLIDDKEVTKMDLYLSDRNVTYTQEGGTWIAERTTMIPYEKANFVYHGTKRPVYADVLPKIERVEEGDSDTADENQISSFPILAASGQITGKSGGNKQNTRKVFELADGGDLKYVEAKGAQQSAIEERKNLRQDIYDETCTPHVSIEAITGSGIGSSGVAIELGFLPATNQARSEQEGDLGMEWQRHLNFQKSAMAVINVAVKPSVSMPVKPKFKIELPRNLTEEYDRIVKLVQAGLMSTRTAVAKLGYTEDIEAEMIAIEKEVAKRAKAALELAQKAKPVEQPTT